MNDPFTIPFLFSLTRNPSQEFPNACNNRYAVLQFALRGGDRMCMAFNEAWHNNMPFEINYLRSPVLKRENGVRGPDPEYSAVFYSKCLGDGKMPGSCMESRIRPIVES